MKEETKTSDVTITKICCLRYVGKSKYITIKAKIGLVLSFAFKY